MVDVYQQPVDVKKPHFAKYYAFAMNYGDIRKNY
jgi:hypothetical protein